jgi:integrase
MWSPFVATPDQSTTPTKIPKNPNLADVAAIVAAAADLAPRKKKDISWALGVVARACAGTVHDVPAVPALLSEKLTKFEPAALGLTAGTFKNAMALTRFALRYAGVIKSPARRIVRFAPAWTEVMRLPKLKNELIGLSRFARFCSATDIAPDQVNDAAFDAFLEELTTQDIARNPRKTHRRATQIWNHQANTTPGWPDQIVTVPSYTQRYALDWNVLPASLTADVDAHLSHLAGGDALSCLDVTPLKASSIRTRRHQIHILVSGMVLSGVDPAALKTLADVVAVGAVRKGLLFLIGRGRDGSKAQVHDVCRTVVSIAKHWAKVPSGHLAELQTFCKRVDPGDEGMSAQNKLRLRQFDDPANVRKLLQLPEKLTKRVRRCVGAPSAADALLVQTALIIEILLMIPIRRHNMVSLDITKHFSRRPDGTVLLMIDGAEVKNGVDVDAVLPIHLVKLLGLYLKIYRPLLMPKPSNWLIPGIEDRHKSRERVGQQVSDTIKRETGLVVNMHLFRHIDAKLYLDQNPGGYGVVQRLEGHKSLATTLKAYSGMERRSAVAHYDQTILKLRGNAA